MKVTLARLTLVAWLAWLLTLGIMSCLSYARILHASFLYMAVPLAVQLICTVAVFGGGIWRIIRGPRRWPAAAWMLLGLLPTLWMGAFIEYLFEFGTGRNHSPNILTYWAEAASSLIGEPYVRVCYPYRYEGERFVMWSDSSKCDEKQMAAMDAHILAMEKSLGRRSDYKVYWVRGPVWGIGGRYVFGWALGSPCSTPSDGTDGLYYMDRHEVAHFVLDQLRPYGDHIEVPMLLIEGWAEFHSGKRSESCRERSWVAQREGELFSLRKLTNPEWFHASAAPMYWQGSVIVDYLLRKFGHDKFIELCSRCHEATFADDIQRVLGLSLDELDRAYQQDLAEQDSPDKRFLMSAKLGDGVDRDQWRRFVEDYCAGAEHLRAQFCQSSVTMVRKINWTDKNKQEKSTDLDRIEYYNDNKRQARIWYYPEHTDARVVTPEALFWLIKDDADRPWRISRYTARDRQRDFDAITTIPEIQLYLETSLDPLQLQSYITEVAITGIRLNDPDYRFVRIYHERTIDWKNIAPRSKRSRGWWDLDPQCDYGLVEGKFEDLDEQGNPTGSAHVTVEYETIDGRHVPKVVRSEHIASKSTSQQWTVKIESCRFGPPPPKVFELASYGDLHPTISMNKPSSQIEIFTWIASGCTLLELLIAAGLSISDLSRLFSFIFKPRGRAAN
jgi:cytochrome c553